MLLEDDEHAMVASDRAQGLEVLYPALAVALFGIGIAESKNLRHSTRSGLQDAILHRIKMVRGIGVDSGKHHDRLETVVPTRLGNHLGSVRRGVRSNDRRPLAVSFGVIGTPG